MRGITLVLSTEKVSLKNLAIEDVFSGKNYTIYKNYNSKFKDEKIFYEDDNYIIAIDGVILNSNDLKIKYAVSSLEDLIIKMYHEYGCGFVDQLRGNFNGLIHIKESNKWEAFTNHLGNKPLYYYSDEEDSIKVISSDLFDIVRILKSFGRKIKLDELGAYYMLTFGYMIMDTTMIDNIKKIDPGTIINIQDNNITKQQYYFLDNENYLNDSEDLMIKNMYELFNLSIKQAFDMEEKYGYKHISYLSGGLDSRMIAVAARGQGYDDITTVTFSQNYSRDEKIARKIAADYGLENIFKSLNNGNFLKRIDEAVDANFGQIIYSGGIHLLSTTKSINLEPYGFLYNGNLADAMHGDYVDAPYHNKPSLKNWAYSDKLLKKVDTIQDEIENKYGNEERFAIYNRGVNAIYNGSISMLDICETCEPFTHQDVIEYCSRMHPKYKYKEALFLKMIQKYYPEACKYKWQKWNVNPTEFNTKFMGTIFGKAFRVIDGKVQAAFTESKNMNPFNKWYDENESLRNFLNGYLKENMHLIDDLNELKEDCVRIYENGSVTEKTQVMTILQFVKRINEI